MIDKLFTQGYQSGSPRMVTNLFILLLHLLCCISSPPSSYSCFPSPSSSSPSFFFFSFLFSFFFSFYSSSSVSWSKTDIDNHGSQLSNSLCYILMKLMLFILFVAQPFKLFTTAFCFSLPVLSSIPPHPTPSTCLMAGSISSFFFFVVVNLPHKSNRHFI